MPADKPTYTPFSLLYGGGEEGSQLTKAHIDALKTRADGNEVKSVRNVRQPDQMLQMFETAIWTYKDSVWIRQSLYLVSEDAARLRDARLRDAYIRLGCYLKTGKLPWTNTLQS